jgi:hypothetical protein
MSETRKGKKNPMFGRAYSEQNNKYNDAKCMKIEVNYLEANIPTISNSIGEAARALNIRQSSISNYFALNQKTPFKKRYLFEEVLLNFY